MISLVLVSLLQVSSGLLDKDILLPWNAAINQQTIEAIGDKGLLVIKGINPNTDSELLVIRMDDNESRDYYSRTNLERRVKPGAFELRISLTGVKKENKKILNVNQLKKLYIFNANKYQSNVRLLNSNEGGVYKRKREKVMINSIHIEQSKPLPEYIQAYDFGGRESELLEGSKRVTLVTNNKSFTPVKLFGQMREVDRPGPEPWGRDGIAGIEELRMPLEKGLWRVILFREDLGEWENLPRQLNLSLAINGIKQPLPINDKSIGQDAENKAAESKAAEWYQREYLKFYHQPANTDPWDEIVRHRGLVQSYDFEQVNNELSIQLLGDSPQQRFISGMILQKLDEKIYQIESNGLQLVNDRREKYFRQHWMVEDQALVVHQDSILNERTLRLAQGEGRLVEFDIELTSDATPQWQSSFIEAGGYVEIRHAVPRWRREGSSQHIKKRYSQLTQLKAEVLNKGAHRVSLWLRSEELQVGQYQFSLAFLNSEKQQVNSIKLAVDVLAQPLPMNEQKVGIYLDHSPHLQFFKEWRPLQLAQIYCDLNYLDRLGLRALSPPMALPTEDNITLWLNELALYKDFYGQADLLAYTPYKGLKAVLDEGALQDKMAKLSKLSHGAMNVYWSIADEALKDQISLIEQDAQQLHSANQFAKAAGHLNNPNQKSLIKQLDLVLINHGYGVDKREIEQIHKSLTPKNETSKRVWLYNMPDFRLAAGAFLWHSKADAYVQWHGRMPTANPYDPTDGREADYQFFYPQPKACMALPDVDKALFELAMGQYELRWYLWLERQAEVKKEPKAQALKEKIADALGNDWQHAQKIDHNQLDQWREQIITLAQSLKHPDKYKALALSGELNEQLIQPRYQDQK